MQKTDKHPDLLSYQDRMRKERMDNERKASRASAAKPIILGSSSRWRAQVLKDAGIPFTVMAADVNEKRIRDVNPRLLTWRIAVAKAVALMPLITEPAFLITADQVISFDGEIREKPRDAAQAREWLAQYRGRMVKAVTAVVVVDLPSGAPDVGSDTVTIRFREYPDSVIDALVADADSGVLQSCGALIHEHPVMAPYVRCYRQNEETDFGPVAHTDLHGGDPDVLTSLSGLPLRKTLEMLAGLGWKK